MKKGTREIMSEPKGTLAEPVDKGAPGSRVRRTDWAAVQYALRAGLTMLHPSEREAIAIRPEAVLIMINA